MLAYSMLVKLFEYNYWANDKLLAAADKLTPDQFNEPSGYGHNSVRNTLYHILRTEWVWRNLTQAGGLPGAPPQVDAFPSVERLRETWREERGLLLDWLEGQDDASLGQEIKVKGRSREEHAMLPWQMLMQLLTHSLQHRSEAAALLTHYNQSPGDMDFITFV